MEMISNDERVLCPPVELIETETTLILKVEIPGVKISDLDVRTTEKAIAINGLRRSKHHSDEKEIFSSQLSYGQIKCTVELPVTIEHGCVEAELVDGILTLIMPKMRISEKKSDRLHRKVEFVAFSN
jgi:HSP20 family protein